MAESSPGVYTPEAEREMRTVMTVVQGDAGRLRVPGNVCHLGLYQEGGAEVRGLGTPEDRGS